MSWFKFDNFFLWNESQDVLNAIENISDIDKICKEHKINETYPIDFINEVRQDEQRVKGVIFLAQKQLIIMNNCCGNDIESQQKAFEDFGQDTLFHDRSPRPLNNRGHMMDEGQSGFYRCHTLTRIAGLLTYDTNEYLQVDKHTALACTIDSVQRPRQSTNDENSLNNSEISPVMLDKFRTFWLQLNFEDIDKRTILNYLFDVK